MAWRKFWIKQGCDKTYCLRHEITWSVDEGVMGQGGGCPQCKPLGLKGSEWEPD